MGSLSGGGPGRLARDAKLGTGVPGPSPRAAVAPTGPTCSGGASSCLDGQPRPPTHSELPISAAQSSASTPSSACTHNQKYSLPSGTATSPRGCGASAPAAPAPPRDRRSTFCRPRRRLRRSPRGTLGAVARPPADPSCQGSLPPRAGCPFAAPSGPAGKGRQAGPPRLAPAAACPPLGVFACPCSPRRRGRYPGVPPRCVARPLRAPQDIAVSAGRGRNST